jgi:glycosyltransferase involved in cell wall biosynthesis
MLVSFVIPTRNQAPFLRKCLDGCLAQKWPHREAVVIDGLSDDGTQAILQSYGDRVRWVSERDAGQSDAVNKGVRLARGEVIAWINSDDYYPHDDVLPRVMALFEADPDLDVVYGDGMMVDSRGLPIRPHRGRPVGSAKDILIYPSSFVMQPALFFRKRVFEAAGGVATDLHWTMDYELWLRLMPQARKHVYLPEQMACATSHGGAKSVRGLWTQIAELVGVKRRYAARLPLNLWDRLLLWRGVGRLYVYWLAVRLGLYRVA